MPGGEDLTALIASMDGSLVCVLFDLDGTLRHNDPSPTKTLFDRAVTMGAPDGAEKRRRIARWTHYYWAQSPELVEDVAAFPEERDFWLNYTTRSLMAFDCTPERAGELAPELTRYMAEEFGSENVIPAEVYATLGALRVAGYRLALLSNREQPCHEELEEWGLDEYFELVMVAGEIDAWKPDPGLFTHALARMGLGAEEVIYVGDNYYADVVGARRAGVQPVLLDPEGVFDDADCPVIHCIAELKSIAAIR